MNFCGLARDPNHYLTFLWQAVLQVQNNQFATNHLWNLRPAFDCVQKKLGEHIMTKSMHPEHYQRHAWFIRSSVFTGYQCTCLSQFTGRNCESEITACFPNPCRNGGSCDPIGNTFICSCKAGLTGVT